MCDIRILLVAGLVLASVEARPSEIDDTDANAPPGAATVSPPSAAPTETPPPPPPVQPPPPQSQPPPAAQAPPGGWVYTQQYGWVWMPYGNAYWYVPPIGYGPPYQYVYYPARGWAWVAAPWIWGVGPWPWFGVVGPVHFGWYAFGWWRAPWHWHRHWHHRAIPFRGVVVVHGKPHRRVAW